MSEEASMEQNSAGEKSGMKRRLFVRTTLGAAGLAYAGALGYPVYRYLAAPVEQAEREAAVTEAVLKDAQKLPPGTALMFKFGARPAMLIHHRDGAWTAFDAVCTHLGCTVRFEPERRRIHCACHGGVYDPKTGANLAGPPPRPLRAYRVKVEEEAVVVSRV